MADRRRKDRGKKLIQVRGKAYSSDTMSNFDILLLPYLVLVDFVPRNFKVIPWSYRQHILMLEKATQRHTLSWRVIMDSIINCVCVKRNGNELETPSLVPLGKVFSKHKLTR